MPVLTGLPLDLFSHKVLLVCGWYEVVGVRTPLVLAHDVVEDESGWYGADKQFI